MKYFTLKINTSQINLLLNELKPFLQASKNNNQYLLYKLNYKNCEIAAYTSGSLVISGEDIALVVSEIKTKLGLSDYEAIGSDEVGTGDLFGPVVVCSCLIRTQDFPLITKLNVRDSKKMSDQEILKVGPILLNSLIHSLFIIPPKDYNELIDSNNNLNKIKALYHNHAFIRTINKYPKKVPIILDQFCSKENYYKYLKESKFIERDIIFKEKAENYHPAVACASIIARYAFLTKLTTYSKKLNYKLLKGAGPKTTTLLKTLIEVYGKGIINQVAKKNFKNVHQALSGAYNSDLFSNS